MPRPKERTQELKDRVLEAALQTLADEGVTGFTTRKVAHGAATSLPAVYELFGAKAGIVREVFFEGFRRLGARLGALRPTDDPRADLVGMVGAIRAFVTENPVLAEVMFSRPFADFDPGFEELGAGAEVREFIVERVKRCGLPGNAVDTAHVIVALAQGLAGQETAGWLGTSKASVERRWKLAVNAVLDGLEAQAP